MPRQNIIVFLKLGQLNFTGFFLPFCRTRGSPFMVGSVQNEIMKFHHLKNLSDGPLAIIP